jgi:hypothetical protein
MIQVILVTLPALWLAAVLGVLGQRWLPLLPLEWLAWLIANAALLRHVGILLVVAGLLLLVLELLRSQRGVVLDSLMMCLGGGFWLAGATLGGGIWGWLAVPGFVLLFTPGLASMLILTMLAGEDSIDASIFTALGFALAAGALQFYLW